MNKRQSKDFYGKKKRHKKYAFSKMEMKSVKLDYPSSWNSLVNMPFELPRFEHEMLANILPINPVSVIIAEHAIRRHNKRLSEIMGCEVTEGAKITGRYGSKSLPSMDKII